LPPKQKNNSIQYPYGYFSGVAHAELRKKRETPKSAAVHRTAVDALWDVALASASIVDEVSPVSAPSPS
jgi:hypothetical protein